MFTPLLLDSIQKLNKERSLSSIYHLFTGKKSAQTLQDARIYRLTKYFGIYKTLDRNHFTSFIMDLKNIGLLHLDQNELGTVTRKGMDYLKSSPYRQETKYMNGLEWEKIAAVFEKRLILFIQTATNIVSNSPSFIAITDDVQAQRWVKQLYRQNKHQLIVWIHALYEELYDFLSRIPDFQASIFVDRLTGYHYYGLSKPQLADKYQLSIHDVNIMITLTLHQLIQYIITNQSKLTKLNIFIEDIIDQPIMTESALKTYDLYKKGYSIDQITHIRHLKESTIQDHLVEIAYVDVNFKIETFVPQSMIQDIEQTIKQLQTRKLKRIKERLDDSCSYFQIRLVIAMCHMIDKKGF